MQFIDFLGIYPSTKMAITPFPLDFGFRIWDLDLGLGFGTWIWDLDLGLDLGLTIFILCNIRCTNNIYLRLVVLYSSVDSQ